MPTLSWISKYHIQIKVSPSSNHLFSLLFGCFFSYAFSVVFFIVFFVIWEAFGRSFGATLSTFWCMFSHWNFEVDFGETFSGISRGLAAEAELSGGGGGFASELCKGFVS